MSGGQSGDACQFDAKRTIGKLAQTFTENLRAMVAATKAQEQASETRDRYEEEYFANTRASLDESVAAHTTLTAKVEEAQLALQVAQTAASIATKEEAGVRDEIHRLYRELDSIAQTMKLDQEVADAAKSDLQALSAKLGVRIAEMERVEERKRNANEALGLLGMQLKAAAEQLEKTTKTTAAVSALLDRAKTQYKETTPNVDKLASAMEAMEASWEDTQKRIVDAVAEFKRACATPITADHNRPHEVDEGRSVTLDPAWQRRMQGWTFLSLQRPNW